MGNGVEYHHISKNLTIKAHDNFHGDGLMDPTLLPLVNGTNPKGNIYKLEQAILKGKMILFKYNTSKKSLLEVSDLFEMILIIFMKFKQNQNIS